MAMVVQAAIQALVPLLQADIIYQADSAKAVLIGVHIAQVVILPVVQVALVVHFFMAQAVAPVVQVLMAQVVQAVTHLAVPDVQADIIFQVEDVKVVLIGTLNVQAVIHQVAHIVQVIIA